MYFVFIVASKMTSDFSLPEKVIEPNYIGIYNLNNYSDYLFLRPNCVLLNFTKIFILHK